MDDGGADAATEPSDATGMPPDAPSGSLENVFWAQSLTGKDTEYVEDVAVVSGDVVVVGDFTEELVLAKGTATETRFTTPQALDSDVFLARYRPDGSLVWAKRFGGSKFDDAAAVAPTPDGGFVIVGRIEGQVTLDAGGAHETTLDAGAGRDVFVARFDGNGGLLWAHTAGSAPSSSGGSDVRVLADGSVIVAGYVAGTTVFGAGEATQTTVTTTGAAEDMFIARYTSAGALAWVKTGGAGGAASTLSQALAITGATEATVAGSFSKTLVLGKGEAAQTSLESAGGDDVFIARYALADGALVSATRFGGPSDDEPHAAASSGDGALIVAGVFSGTVNFGPAAGQTFMTAGPNDFDIFVAKLAADGTLAWVQHAGGTDFDSAEGLTLAADGSAFVSGGFGLTASFPGSLPAQLVASGPHDGFVARYAADGTPGTVRRFGGAGYDYGGAVVILPGDGSLVWAGSFEASVTVGATTLTAPGPNSDAFLLRTAP